nr:NinD protein [Salmonella phage SEN22]
MKHCYRCGESKDDYRFRLNQPYWHQWCIRCERSPVGNFPLPRDEGGRMARQRRSIKTANTYQRNAPEINQSQSPQKVR